jgi:hypothetical protein
LPGVVFAYLPPEGDKMKKNAIAIVAVVAVGIGFCLALANGEYGGDIHFVQQYNQRTGEPMSVWETIFTGVITVSIMNFLPACVAVMITGIFAALIREKPVDFDLWFPFKLSYFAAFALWLLHIFNVVRLSFAVI